MYRAHICKPFKEPRSRFSAWRAVSDNPICQATWAGGSAPWNRFLASLNIHKYGLWPPRPGVGGINSLESIPGLPKNFKILPLFVLLRSSYVVFLASILLISGLRSSLRFDLFKFLNKQTLIRLDLSTVWNKQSFL